MKMSGVLTLFCGAALLFASVAVARESNKSSVQLDDKVVVEGKTLDSGHYTVEWNGNGPAVQVTLLQGKDTIATFPAHVIEQASANFEDAYGTAAESNGSLELTTIYPGGKHFVLQVDRNTSNQQSNTSPSK